MNNNHIEALINYCEAELRANETRIIALDRNLDELSNATKRTEAYQFNDNDRDAPIPISVTDINNADLHKDELLNEYEDALAMRRTLEARERHLVEMLQSVTSSRRGGKRKTVRKNRKKKTVKKGNIKKVII
jgi:exonuclease VII small subunit